MAAFGADGRCLMRALQEELDDPDPVDCGVCAVCTAPRFDGPLDPTLVREAALHLRSRPLVLDVKKMAPDPEGKMQQARRGRARRGGPRARAPGRRRLGPADRRRAAAPATSTTSWSRPRPRRCGPGARRSAGSPPCPPGAAARSSRTSRSGSPWRSSLPFHDVLERVGDNPPQREMTNSVQQVANVRGEELWARQARATSHLRSRRCSSSASSRPWWRSPSWAAHCGCGRRDDTASGDDPTTTTAPGPAASIVCIPGAGGGMPGCRGRGRACRHDRTGGCHPQPAGRGRQPRAGALGHAGVVPELAAGTDLRGRAGRAPLFAAGAAALASSELRARGPDPADGGVGRTLWGRRDLAVPR